MKKEKTMIAIDLDGTLLNKGCKVTEESKKYLKKLKDKGYIITIATGRVLISALRVTDGAEFANYIITDTGPAIYKMPEERAIYSKTISTEIAERFLNYFNEDKMRFIDIGTPKKILKFTKKYPEDSGIIMNYDNKKLILNDAKEITHITISFTSNEYVKEYQEMLTKEFPELDVAIMQDSFKRKQFIETHIKNESKSKAMMKVAKIEDIKNENIIAFGDSSNDKDMIKKADTGVAMQNAFQDIKDVAKYVTEKTHDENGVIEFLKKYLK